MSSSFPAPGGAEQALENSCLLHSLSVPVNPSLLFKLDWKMPSPSKC